MIKLRGFTYVEVNQRISKSCVEGPKDMPGVEFANYLCRRSMSKSYRRSISEIYDISRIDVRNLYRRFTSMIMSKMSVVDKGRRTTWRAEFCRRSNYKGNLVRISKAEPRSRNCKVYSAEGISGIYIEGRTAKMLEVEPRRLEVELGRSRVIMKS
jgi:hypothetical protein